MTAAYQLTSTGVLRRGDGAFIPNQADNRDWQEYLAWVSAGNTADPAPTPSLAEAKAAAVAQIEAQYSRLAAAEVLHSAPRGFADALLLREVDRIEADGSPDAADYPMLDELVPDYGADVATVGATLRAEFDARATALAPLEKARRDGVAAVNAAADSAAVATALAAVAWP